MNIVIISILVLGLTGFLFGILLALLSTKLKVKDDKRVKEVLDVLPGINCGACGFSGCRAFAEAVVKKRDIFSGCIPGGDKVNNGIRSILGLSGSPGSVRRVAVCHCGAGEREKKITNDYQGPSTCRAADIAGAAIDCLYGCIGLGDCERACPVGAIKVRSKKVYIDIDICIGCGKCVEACPRNLFELVAFNKNTPIYYVACNNKDRGVEVKSVCSSGCIGCGICVQVDDSPFVVENNLSRVKREKAVSVDVFRAAASKCPTKCIIENNGYRDR